MKRPRDLREAPGGLDGGTQNDVEGGGKLEENTKWTGNMEKKMVETKVRFDFWFLSGSLQVPC